MKRKLLNTGKIEKAIIFLLCLKLTIEAQKRVSGIKYSLLRTSVVVMCLLCRNMYNQLYVLHSVELNFQHHLEECKEVERYMI